MSGMVYMGEYSSACVCEVPRSTSSTGREPIGPAAGAAGASGAAAGVIMQMARQRQQQGMVTMMQ
jgi:hypothetical protein